MLPSAKNFGIMNPPTSNSCPKGEYPWVTKRETEYVTYFKYQGKKLQSWSCG